MDAGSVVVRPVAADDLGQWLPLWAAYNAFYGRSGPTALPDPVTRTAWSRFLDPDEPMHALVAESDGRLLGLAHHLFHRATNRIEPSCYLQDLYVSDAARGRGIGRRLIEHVAAHAREAGAGRLYWQTHGSNATAMALYDTLAQRSGFIVYVKPL